MQAQERELLTELDAVDELDLVRELEDDTVDDPVEDKVDDTVGEVTDDVGVELLSGGAYSRPLLGFVQR